MQIEIRINTENKAFDGRVQPEVSTILRSIASQIREHGTLRVTDRFTGEISDRDGHTCGSITVTP